MMDNYMFMKNKYINLVNKNGSTNITLTKFKKEKIISQPIKIYPNIKYVLKLDLNNKNRISFDIKLCSLNEDIIYDYEINFERNYNFTRQIISKKETLVYIKINIRKGKYGDVIQLKNFKLNKIENFNNEIKIIEIISSDELNSINSIKKKKEDVTNELFNIKFYPCKSYRTKILRNSYNLIGSETFKDTIFSYPVVIEPNTKYYLELNIENNTSRRIRIFIYDNSKNYALDQDIINRVKLKKIILYSDIKNFVYLGIKPVRFIRGDIISLKKLKLTKINEIEGLEYDNIIKIPKIYKMHNEKLKQKQIIKKNTMTKNTINKNTRKKNIKKLKNNEIEKANRIVETDIVQIIFPITHGRVYFMRTLLIPKENNIMYLIQEECKEMIENNYIFKKFLNKIIFVNNIEQIKELLKKIKAKKIVLTVAPHKMITKKLSEHQNNIFYIHHGIILDERVSRILNNRWDLNINYMVANHKATNILKDTYIMEQNISLINGLPQFDYILENKQYLPNYKNNFLDKFPEAKNKKIILLVNASANIKYYRDKIFLTMIVDLFNSMKNFNYFLIIKNKYKTTYNFDQDNIYELTETDMIYNYFFSDVVIIVEGGTALIESLFFNFNKTIFIDWYERNNDLFETDKLKMIRSENCIELKDNINNILNNNQSKDKLMKKEVDNYIFNILGYNKIRFVSDNIVKMLRENQIDEVFKYRI